MAAPRTSSSTSTFTSSNAKPEYHDLTPTPPSQSDIEHNLLAYQRAVGIPIEVNKRIPSICRQNRGIYLIAQREEKHSKFKYHFFEFTISTLLMLQIVLAACLTAFGASTINRNIIIVFGTFNTALAGTVALMKGQGLPNRLRQDWNGWRSLRDYIEEKEREISAGKPGVDVWKEVRLVEEKYDAVWKTTEINRPDAYTVMSGADAKPRSNVGAGKVDAEKGESNDTPPHGLMRRTTINMANL